MLIGALPAVLCRLWGSKGRRPSVEASFAEAHPEYVAMMHRCWHDAPGERPVMQDVVLFFTESGRQWGAV